MDSPVATRRYGFGTTVAGPYEQVIERTKAALREQGFGVLTEIDVQRTLKEKLGAEFRPYIILGACNPPLVQRALQTDLGVGLLLPCNVVVYDNGNGTCTVEALDPVVLLEVVGDSPGLAEVAREAKERLRQALATLAAEVR